MSDRDAWINFLCTAVKGGYSYSDSAPRVADLMLELLRERDKQKLFDRVEGGYRNAPEVK